MNLLEAAKQALDAMEDVQEMMNTSQWFNDRVTALRHAIEQSEKQEPVYGYCPICGSKGVTRERRIHGNDRCERGHVYKSSTALRQAIEQAEKQEPVGYLFDFTCDDELVKDWFVLLDYPTVWEKSAHNIRPLYTVLQREWVGLTDEEVSETLTEHHGWQQFAKAIEAKLKEKNK